MKTLTKTRYISDYEYEATNSQGLKVKIDMKNQDKLDQSPMELVLSALSGCIAVEVALMIQKRRKTLTDFVIEAEGTRRDEAPKYYTDIHLKFVLTSPDANEEELGKVAKLSLEKYCSVASSLKADITFSTEIIRG
ncbi:OsmC family protein [Fulvivirga sp. 29W222]|uniref:OsmC family protein n=1 Tax=Fulvivirga marina TaxID=2494733 RepID=A0A937FTF5_9BACT|nr:OsmC family protein [Fulvivirga marina]MBL6445314.1 OsmC family protein [Fulvivirga marina]